MLYANVLLHNRSGDSIWRHGRRFVFNIGETSGAAYRVGWGGVALPQWGPGITSGKFYMPNRAFLEYLCDEWSTEWVHFALLNTDVEAFLNKLSY